MDIRRFEKEVEIYKNLDGLVLNEIYDCTNLEAYLSNAKISDSIKVFNEIKRENLNFILEFITNYENHQFYISYFLKENLIMKVNNN